MRRNIVFSTCVSAIAATAFLGMVIATQGQDQPAQPASGKLAISELPNAPDTVGLEMRKLNEKATRNLAREWAELPTPATTNGVVKPEALQLGAKLAPQLR